MRCNTLHHYFQLTKPRVVLLMWITAAISMLLAAPAGHPPWHALLWGSLGIVLCASAGATINQLIDRRIDALMARTQNRPIPQGHVTPLQGSLFAAVLIALGAFVLAYWVNWLTLVLSLATFIGYAFIYTGFLKRATPQNIVIGGLAGAMPPLLGWTAVTGQMASEAIVLVLIIFSWTPPHFWALAISRIEDYKKTQWPMLPVTHGIPVTKFCINLYTFLLIVLTYLPTLLGHTYWVYPIGMTLLNGYLIYLTYLFYRSESLATGYRVFKYSIYYLTGLFVLLLIDHYLAALLV